MSSPLMIRACRCSSASPISRQLVRAESGMVIDCPDWEWAEFDNRRLVWATSGKLFSGTLTANGLTEETLLFDFNTMEFESIEAPY